MLLIQNKRVNWESCQIGIPGATAKDKENRRIPFNPEVDSRQSSDAGRRSDRRPTCSERRPGRTSRTSRRPGRRFGCSLMASNRSPAETGAEWNREQLQRIDLRWHDLRHEGACRLLADGVDIRIIQLMLGHASIQQTQRYLNVTDEELRRGLEVSWNNKGRPLRLASGS